MKTNRNGKIARLPLVVREELNRRIEDGWSGRRVVRWLNELPEVRGVLAGEFGGRAIVAQNVSAWKQGGYREWVGDRKAMELARRMGEDWEKMQDAGARTQDDPRPDGEDGKRSMLETLAFWTVMQLGATAWQQLRTVEGKEKWRMMRDLVADVCRLRGAEQAGQRMGLQERRIRVEEMKWGIRNAECGMRGVLAEGRMGSDGVEEDGTEVSDAPKVELQVPGVEMDQGKSRQIKGGKILEGEGMERTVAASSVIKVHQRAAVRRSAFRRPPRGASGKVVGKRQPLGGTGDSPVAFGGPPKASPQGAMPVYARPPKGGTTNPARGHPPCEAKLRSEGHPQVQLGNEVNEENLGTRRIPPPASRRAPTSTSSHQFSSSTRLRSWSAPLPRRFRMGRRRSLAGTARRLELPRSETMSGIPTLFVVSPFGGLLPERVVERDKTNDGNGRSIFVTETGHGGG